MFESDLVQFEVSGPRATMYVLGRISVGHIPALRDECDRLPASVHSLRISIAQLEVLGSAAPTIVQELRRHWQFTRQGSFRVAFAASQPDPSARDLAGG